MSLVERIGLRVLRGLDPETAHGLALKALHTGLAPLPGPVRAPRLAVTLAGLDLPNPVGLAAGFDKNATALGPLMRAGFGFLEVGAATPRPQPGNPRPRLFRLSEDHAAINRFGFNNDGAEAIATRLAARPGGIPVGLNLGANKDSDDRAADFARVLRICGPHADFVTVNVSSPNTEKLRDLQGADALRGLLGGVMEARAGLARPMPVFLKIAPDLTDAEIAQIAAVAMEARVAAVIATNTTLSRE
jgi:dihydroorotate dehydrogenase